MAKYGIAEWYGEPFANMPPSRRQALAARAVGGSAGAPVCPFQQAGTRCSKKGGVCSIREYREHDDLFHGVAGGRIGEAVGSPVIVCPRRFEQNDVIPNWLASIVGFDTFYVAREVPFMRSPSTGKPAGRIDLVVCSDVTAKRWYGLEIQAVYFSGGGMTRDFELLRFDIGERAPLPTTNRRPDWRSSSAKRLMPQLEVKAPTLRRWLTKLAVAVDLPFFEAIGGPSPKPSQDTNDGDIIWLVPRMNDSYSLERHHWEVLSLEESSRKLLSADMVNRSEFEDNLRAKLRPLADS